MGQFRATGYKPACLDRLKSYGIHLPESIFREESRSRTTRQGQLTAVFLLVSFLIFSGALIGGGLLRLRRPAAGRSRAS